MAKSKAQLRHQLAFQIAGMSKNLERILTDKSYLLKKDEKAQLHNAKMQLLETKRTLR